ncbi:MAG: hypothetical protein LQ351_003325 [Letrouitia transgressa]|nr:MAG: hypothetical protein LQ351_003325 [Letrouitia transgressa]
MIPLFFSSAAKLHSSGAPGHNISRHAHHPLHARYAFLEGALEVDEVPHPDPLAAAVLARHEDPVAGGVDGGEHGGAGGGGGSGDAGVGGCEEVVEGQELEGGGEVGEERVLEGGEERHGPGVPPVLKWKAVTKGGLRRNPPTSKPSSTETQIRSAFDIFAQPCSPSPSDSETDANTDTGSYLPTPSLKPALQSLNCLPASRSQLQEIYATADPTSLGRIRWGTFLPLAELLMQEKKKKKQHKNNNKKKDYDDDSEDGDDDYHGSDEEEGEDADDERDGATMAQHEQEEDEVDDAFRLFVSHGGRGEGAGKGKGRSKGKDQEGRITLETLRSVARALKEEVDEGVLRDMILEANGGAGDLGVGKGVGRREFEGVMRRAGLFK